VIVTNATYDQFSRLPAREHRYLFEIAGYARGFTSWPSGAAGQYPWIKEESGVGDMSQRVQELEGNSTLSDLVITIIDRGDLITADLAANVLEGKTATLKVGFKGMRQSDFVTFATMVVDSVAEGETPCDYAICCKEFSRKVKKVIYRTGDSGRPTSNNDPKTLTGNPMTLLLDILQTECGLPALYINTAAITALRDGLFAGMRMKFQLTKAPEAKAFLDAEIFKALGGYAFQDALGRFTPVFWIPTVAPVSALTLTREDIEGIGKVSQAELKNVLSYRFDDAEDKFQSELTEVGATSAIYGIEGQHIIESRGMRSYWQAWGYARLLARVLFLRYGAKNLVYDLESRWRAAVLEPGDYARITHAKVRDRVGGVRGITNRLAQVLEITRKFSSGKVGLKLLDVGWLDALGPYQVAPDATPDWVAASPAEKAALMFVCDDAMGEYSDGTPGHEVF